MIKPINSQNGDDVNRDLHKSLVGLGFDDDVWIYFDTRVNDANMWQ